MNSQIVARTADNLLAWNRRGLALLSGGTPAFALAFAYQVALAARGLRVHNLDGANRFDVYRLADESLLRGLPVERTLSAISVQRAFTPYQMLDVLHGIARRGDSRTLYCALAPCKQFFDNDVRADEGAYLLDRMLRALENVRARRLALLIVEREYEHPGFAGVRPRLRALASYYCELSPLGRPPRSVGWRDHVAYLADDLPDGDAAADLFESGALVA